MREILFGALATGLIAIGANAQSVDSNGCLRLIGSIACPGFAYAYLNPSNLSNAFPFFADVTDVASFDAGAIDYFSNPHEFKQTKFVDELGCTNASNAVIRWERTVLCSQWVNEKWSAQCLGLYNGTSAATSQKMVCQDTCLQYSASEYQIVNSSFCPGTPTITDGTNGNRTYWLNKDFVDCTNWTTLATNDSNTCVSGQDNENNCGFGSSVSQLCGFCSGSNPSDCCYNSNNDMSVCGYVLPARTSTSASSSTASSTSASSSASSAGDNSGVSHHGLSGGQIAGIVVGSVLGGLLLLALLVFLCFRNRRKNSRDSGLSFGVFNGQRHSQAPNNSSEKGLLGTSQSMAAASSPTMGGSTSLMGKHGESIMSSLGGQTAFASAAALVGGGGAMGAGAAGAGAAGAGAGGAGAPSSFAGPGERTSGVVLPRVRDENQNGDMWIETGSEVNVLWPYAASLPDELDLRPGMKLRVLRLYDDAWGTAQVISTTGDGEGSEVGKQGAFPIVCVSEGTSIGSSFSHGSSIGSH